MITLKRLAPFFVLILLTACGFPRFRRFVQESTWSSAGIRVSISLEQEFDDHGRPVKSEKYGLYLLSELCIPDSFIVADTIRCLDLLGALLQIDSFLVLSGNGSEELRLPIGRKLDLRDHSTPEVRMYSEYFPVSDSSDTIRVQLLYSSYVDTKHRLPLDFVLVRNEKREFYVY